MRWTLRDDRMCVSMRRSRTTRPGIITGPPITSIVVFLTLTAVAVGGPCGQHCASSCCGFSDPARECSGCDPAGPMECKPDAECYDTKLRDPKLLTFASDEDVPDLHAVQRASADSQSGPDSDVRKERASARSQLKPGFDTPANMPADTLSQPWITFESYAANRRPGDCDINALFPVVCEEPASASLPWLEAVIAQPHDGHGTCIGHAMAMNCPHLIRTDQCAYLAAGINHRDWSVRLEMGELLAAAARPFKKGTQVFDDEGDSHPGDIFADQGDNHPDDMFDDERDNHPDDKARSQDPSAGIHWSLGSPKCLPALAEVIEQHDMSMRWIAVASMERIASRPLSQSERTKSQMVAATSMAVRLGHWQPGTRWMAIKGVARFGRSLDKTPEGIEAIVRRLRDDMGFPGIGLAALEALHDLCTSEDCVSVAFAQLANLTDGTQSGADGVNQNHASDGQMVRWLVVESVLRLAAQLRLTVSSARLGELLEPIQKLTEHSDPSVRVAAVAAMAPWPTAIAHLRFEDPDGSVRCAALKACAMGVARFGASSCNGRRELGGQGVTAVASTAKACGRDGNWWDQQLASEVGGAISERRGSLGLELLQMAVQSPFDGEVPSSHSEPTADSEATVHGWDRRHQAIRHRRRLEPPSKAGATNASAAVEVLLRSIDGTVALGGGATSDHEWGQVHTSRWWAWLALRFVLPFLPPASAIDAATALLERLPPSEDQFEAKFMAVKALGAALLQGLALLTRSAFQPHGSCARAAAALARCLDHRVDAIRFASGELLAALACSTKHGYGLSAAKSRWTRELVLNATFEHLMPMGRLHPDTYTRFAAAATLRWIATGCCTHPVVESLESLLRGHWWHEATTLERLLRWEFDVPGACLDGPREGPKPTEQQYAEDLGRDGPNVAMRRYGRCLSSMRAATHEQMKRALVHVPPREELCANLEDDSQLLSRGVVIVRQALSPPVLREVLRHFRQVEAAEQPPPDQGQGRRYYGDLQNASYVREVSAEMLEVLERLLATWERAGQISHRLRRLDYQESALPQRLKIESAQYIALDPRRQAYSCPSGVCNLDWHMDGSMNDVGDRPYKFWIMVDKQLPQSSSLNSTDADTHGATDAGARSEVDEFVRGASNIVFSLPEALQHACTALDEVLDEAEAGAQCDVTDAPTVGDHRIDALDEAAAQCDVTNAPTVRDHRIEVVESYAMMQSVIQEEELGCTATVNPGDLIFFHPDIVHRTQDMKVWRLALQVDALSR